MSLLAHMGGGVCLADYKGPQDGWFKAWHNRAWNYLEAEFPGEMEKDGLSPVYTLARLLDEYRIRSSGL